MATAQVARAQELQSLATQINSAVDGYAQGGADYLNDIAEKCQRLQQRAEPAEVFAERLRYQPLQVCALLIAIEGGVLQALSRCGQEDATADRLAETTNRSKVDIVRVMRLLTAIGVCDEVGAQRYRANDKTHVMASRGQIGGLRVSSVPVSGIITKAEDYFSKRAQGTPSEQAPASAYSYTYGKSMYEILGESEQKREDFDAYMEARKQDKKRRWHQIYPVISELNARPVKSSTTIVDVGGSRGHELASFAERYPAFDCHLIVQDLPETIKPLEGGQHAFEAMPYDFFTEQPIKGATLYLLLACLHNWDDESSCKILKNLAAAMQKGHSRLLISGVVVADVGASRRAAELDMQMWMLQNTRQRTESDWKQLVADAGLEIVKVWNNGGDRESIIETRLFEELN